MRISLLDVKVLSCLHDVFLNSDTALFEF